MKVYEILYKVYLLEDISLKEVQREIFRIIDITLGKSEDTLRLHNKNDFKNYCFNSFYPIEKDGIYKEGNIYTITIRTIDKSLMTYFSKNLPFAYTTRNKKIIKPFDRFYYFLNMDANNKSKISRKINLIIEEAEYILEYGRQNNYM